MESEEKIKEQSHQLLKKMNQARHDIQETKISYSLKRIFKPKQLEGKPVSNYSWMRTRETFHWWYEQSTEIKKNLNQNKAPVYEFIKGVILKKWPNKEVVMLNILNRRNFSTQACTKPTMENSRGTNTQTQENHPIM